MARQRHSAHVLVPLKTPRVRFGPADLALKRSRTLQVLRRLSIFICFAGVIVAPLWQLARIEAESAGIAGGGRWARLAQWLPHPSSSSPVVGAPWTVEVFGIEFLDPLAAASLLAARVFDWRIALGALPVVVLLAFLGRFFCGWMCPYLPFLGASNAARSVLTRLKVPLLDVQLPRRFSLIVLAAVLLATAVGGTQLAPLIYPPSVIGREAFRSVFFGGLGAGALLVLGAFLFDTFVSRAGFCRSLCPGGALFGLIGAASPLKVRRKAQDCTDCTLCDVVCNLGQKPMTDGLDFGCEKCGKCISVCPTGALSFELGRPAGLVADALSGVRQGGHG